MFFESDMPTRTDTNRTYYCVLSSLFFSCFFVCLFVCLFVLCCSFYITSLFLSSTKLFSCHLKVLRDGKSQEYQDYKALESVPAEMLVDTSTLNSRALVTPTITDNRNGSYTVVYVPSMTGEYVIDCRLYDEHVQRSPARLSVYFNCPHKECQDAMAVLHNELLSYEEKETGAAAQAPAGPSVEQKQAQELKSLRTILAGKQNLSNEGISGLKQLLADEQTARAAAEKEVKRLRDLLAALQQ